MTHECSTPSIMRQVFKQAFNKVNGFVSSQPFVFNHDTLAHASKYNRSSILRQIVISHLMIRRSNSSVRNSGTQLNCLLSYSRLLQVIQSDQILKMFVVAWFGCGPLSCLFTVYSIKTNKPPHRIQKGREGPIVHIHWIDPLLRHTGVIKLPPQKLIHQKKKKMGEG